MKLFPELPEKQRIQAELNQIGEAEAEREWSRVKFYQRKRKPRAVAISCNWILTKYPNSKYTEMARDVLRQMQPGRISISDDEEEYHAPSRYDTETPNNLQPGSDNLLPGRMSP